MIKKIIKNYGVRKKTNILKNKKLKRNMQICQDELINNSLFQFVT